MICRDRPIGQSTATTRINKSEVVLRGRCVDETGDANSMFTLRSDNILSSA